MKIVSLIVLYALSAIAYAAPFVTGSVASGVSSCGVVLDGGAKVSVTAAASTCKFDVGGVSAGTHTVTMTAITANDPIWGTQESAASPPFSFTRPATPPVPTGLGLTAQ